MCQPYYTTMRESKDPRNLRLRMVQMARDKGIKPTARSFKTSPQTVRKWFARWDGSWESLADENRAPHHHPKTLTESQKAEIIAHKKRNLSWSAPRLKRQLDLPYSVRTIQKVLSGADLCRRWKLKKHETKHNLRSVKRDWPFLHQLCVDTKDLSDIPEYWPLMKFLGFPRYEYTARDVSTGLVYLAFSDQLSLTFATLFARILIRQFQAWGVDLSNTTWQTDNGSEFIGAWNAKEDSVFTKAIQSVPGQIHRTIPPGAHRFQADVETVHSLIETEFYRSETFLNRQDFIDKATLYQHSFNYVRKNSYKENKTPLQLMLDKSVPNALHLPNLPPVFLDRLFVAQGATLLGGNDVGDIPSFDG